MSDVYTPSDGEVVESWSQSHQNDDETHVAVLRLGENCVAVAVDFDAEGEVIASELVAGSITQEEAEARAQRWLEENPKGVKGDGLIGGLLGSDDA